MEPDSRTHESRPVGHEMVEHEQMEDGQMEHDQTEHGLAGGAPAGESALDVRDELQGVVELVGDVRLAVFEEVEAL